MTFESDILTEEVQEQKKNEERDNLKRQKLIQAYKNTFSGPDGQIVFWDLMKKTYVFRAFGQHNAGAYAMEGKRELGLYILSAVQFTENDQGLKQLVMDSKNNEQRRRKNG